MTPDKVALINIDDFGVEVFGQQWHEVCSARGDLYRITSSLITNSNNIAIELNKLIESKEKQS